MAFLGLSRAFFKSLLKNPRSMGTVVPSSPELAKKMATCIDLSKEGLVLELGPGTGVVTQAILATGLPPENLIALELSPHFSKDLRTEFPKIQVIEGDAKNIVSIMQGKRIHTIISSLPLRSLPKESVEKILSEIAETLAPGGQFIQFTYALGWNSDFHPKNMTCVNSFVVWKNLPPARVDIFLKN